MASRRITPVEREQILAALRSGKSLGDVSLAFSRSPNTVADMARANGIIPSHCGCGAKLGRFNSSGGCSACASRSPQGRARRAATAALHRSLSDPEVRVKGYATKRTQSMSWCPAAMVETYRYLMTHKVKAAEARRMVLEMHEAEGRREVRRIAAEQEARERRRIAQEY